MAACAPPGRLPWPAMRPFPFALAALVALVASGGAAPGSARAEEPTLVPPRLIAQEPAAYPPGAEGAADVLLELVVGADGRVASVSVLSGGPPFAAAARETAARYVFEPARRGEARPCGRASASR